MEIFLWCWSALMLVFIAHQVRTLRRLTWRKRQLERELEREES